MIKNLHDILPVTTSHGVGQKRVLLASNESGCSLTQIAVTDLDADEIATAHVHPDMQEAFYVLSGELEVTLDGQTTICHKDDFVYVDRCTSHEMHAITPTRIMTIGCVIEASRNKLYPMLFKQNRKTLVWGTEDWTVSAVPGSESEVENGTWARYRLTDVIQKLPTEILGKQVAAKYHNQLPLLTKIISAHDDLSIQVHPNDEMALREHNKFGKSEMWYILDAQPGAYLYAGFKEHITPEQFKHLIEESNKPVSKPNVVCGEPVEQMVYGPSADESPLELAIGCEADDECTHSISDAQTKAKGSEGSPSAEGVFSGFCHKDITAVLAKHYVKPGDVFYLPAGRVHAICGGITLAEVQQSSDVTYRIYDYNRPGLDGRPRELHTELAAQAIDYTVYPDYKTESSLSSNLSSLSSNPSSLSSNPSSLSYKTKDDILNTPYFSVKVLETTQPFHRNMIKYDSFIILLNLGPDCTIHIRSTKDEIILKANTSCLIPAAIADYDIIPQTIGEGSANHSTVKILETFINNKKTIGKLISDFFHLS